MTALFAWFIVLLVATLASGCADSRSTSPPKTAGTVAPKFDAHACAANIDGIHLGGANRPVAADIATYYKTMP